MRRKPERRASGLRGGEAGTFEQPLQGLSVLVVEGDEEAANTTARLLRLWEHEVRVAPDGPAALRAAQDGQPDVVLLDIGLPGDVDGYGVARRIGEWSKWKRPLLVAVTGSGREEDRRRSVEAGIDLLLVKPVDPDRLHWLLRRFQAVIM